MPAVIRTVTGIALRGAESPHLPTIYDAS